MSQSRLRNDKDKLDRTQDENPINCIQFTYEQLRKATKEFHEDCKLGEGGFGPVYKGTLLYTTVAIKKLRKVSVGLVS